MTPQILGAVTLTVLSLTSSWFYGRSHRGRRPPIERRPKLNAPQVFGLVHTWVRYSTFLVGVGALLTPHPAWLVVHWTMPQMLLGLVTAVFGVVLFVDARQTIGPQYSPCYDGRVPTEIVRIGIYSWIRHPIYTANLITVLGCAVATGSLWLIANAVLLGACYARIVEREERALAQRLPEYGAYIQQTGRFLPRATVFVPATR